jgi:hypothetical protein
VGVDQQRSEWTSNNTKAFARDISNSKMRTTFRCSLPDELPSGIPPNFILVQHLQSNAKKTSVNMSNERVTFRRTKWSSHRACRHRCRGNLRDPLSKSRVQRLYNTT